MNGAGAVRGLGAAVARLGLASFFILASCFFGLGWAQSDGPAAADALAPIIQAMLASDSPPALDARGLDIPALRRFYDARNDAPAWTGSVEAQQAAALLLAALDRAGDDGLDPADYHVSALTAHAAAADPTTTAERELLLTDAFLHYAHDMRLGRATPDDVDDEIALPVEHYDAGAALALALKEGSLAALIADLPPHYAEYTALKTALKAYRERLAAGEWPQVPDGDEIKLDGNDPRLPALRKRLAQEDPALAPTQQAARKGDLAEAIKRFQARNGLEPDGRAGTRTLAMLNISITERIAQIVANMERWRWMPRTIENSYVMVNTADGTLRVVEDGSVVLTSKVVVGDEKHPSPILRAVARSVTVNPPWNVPMSIAVKEMLPKLKHDPTYLMGEEIVVLNGPDGDPYGVNVNWRRYSKNHFPYVLQQLPGPKNALGQLKIELPNRFDVYLHDTPSKKLFARAQRDFSHGCIRVEEVMGLASLLLTGNTDDAVEDLKSKIEDGATYHLPAKHPLPVYVVYWTVVTDADGAISFRPDTYGRDARVISAIASRVRLSMPGPGQVSHGVRQGNG
ncbi:MAG TPA: L,D-transpeptidase family protein [Alphaproteobacteria bacterium]|nr:L,D-transpeptidase family protein [Alphaproteobacteria bacterium]